MIPKERALRKIGLTQYIANRFDLNVHAAAEILDDYPEVLDGASTTYEEMLNALATAHVIDVIQTKANARALLSARQQSRRATPMSEHTAESQLRLAAKEIADQEGISLSAALKVASANNVSLANQARAERHGRPMVPPRPTPAIPVETKIAAALFDEIQEVQRELRLSFTAAYEHVSEKHALALSSDAAALGIFIDLAAHRAATKSIEMGVAMDEMRWRTPKLWSRASRVEKSR